MKTLFIFFILVSILFSTLAYNGIPKKPLLLKNVIQKKLLNICVVGSTLVTTTNALAASGPVKASTYDCPSINIILSLNKI
jgi:hypothetical protein